MDAMRGLSSLRPSFESLQYPFESADYGLTAHAFAVAGEAARLARDIGRARPSKAHRADGFLRRAAAGTGDSGDRNGERGPAALQRAARHLARGFLAHRAVAGERRGVNPEQLALGVVGVRDEAAI